MFGHKAEKYAGEVEYKDNVTGKSVVHGIMQCRHCGGHWEVVPGSGRQRGWCMNCSGPLCGAAHCMCHCEPFEKQVEQIRRRALDEIQNQLR